MSFPPTPPVRLLLKNIQCPSREKFGTLSIAVLFTVGPRFTGACHGAFLSARFATQRSARPDPPVRFEPKYRLFPSGESAGPNSPAAELIVAPRLVAADHGPNFESPSSEAAAPGDVEARTRIVASVTMTWSLFTAFPHIRPGLIARIVRSTGRRRRYSARQPRRHRDRRSYFCFEASQPIGGRRAAIFFRRSLSRTTIKRHGWLFFALPVQRASSRSWSTTSSGTGSAEY